MLVNLRMSSLDQMKMPGLIDLSIILILASNTKGQSWNVNVSRRIHAEFGSDVTIPCTFTYPPQDQTKDVQVYWKNHEKSKYNINDKDTNAFVFHTNETLVVEKYKGKTKLIGDKAKGNCSLKIHNIEFNESNIYVRVIAKDNFSFLNNPVSIYVSERGFKPVIRDQDIIILSSTFTPITTIGTTRQGMTSTEIYMAIFIPVAALLIIIFVAGIVFFIKHKRSQSFTREESGYYENFSTASSNQAKREAFCKKQDKELPELKTIDDPVYINIEASPGQMDQSMDQADYIYANVDYSK